MNPRGKRHFTHFLTHLLQIRGPGIWKIAAGLPVFDFLPGAETLQHFISKDLQIALVPDEGELAGTVAEEGVLFRKGAGEGCYC